MVTAERNSALNAAAAVCLAAQQTHQHMHFDTTAKRCPGWIDDQ